MEKAKQKSMNADEWDRDTASASEEVAGADSEHHKVEDHDEHMEDLQKQTANETQENHPEAKDK